MELSFQEILSGEVPYAHISSDFRVMEAVRKKVLPSKPMLSRVELGPLWDICITHCWRHAPEERMSINGIATELKHASQSLHFRTLLQEVPKNTVESLGYRFESLYVYFLQSYSDVLFLVLNTSSMFLLACCINLKRRAMS